MSERPCVRDGAFTRQSFTGAGFTHDVLVAGEGPAVILLHEVSGVSSQCLEFASRLVVDGFTLFVPVLYGVPGQSSGPLEQIWGLFCLRRELHLFARGKTSPIVKWLHALADHAAKRTGREQVGIIGMCLTGGLVFGTLAHPAIGAAVASQPSLPAAWWPPKRAAAWADLCLADSDLTEAAASATPLLALRFKGDPVCPAARFCALRERFGTAPEVVEQAGDLEIRRAGRLTTIEIEGDDHAVLTLPHEPALDCVTAFLHEHLG